MSKTVFKYIWKIIFEKIDVREVTVRNKIKQKTAPDHVKYF